MGFYAIDGVRTDETGRISAVSCGAILLRDGGPSYVAAWSEVPVHEVHTKILAGDVFYAAKRVGGRIFFGSKFKAVGWGHDEGIEIDTEVPEAELCGLRKL